MVRAEDRTEEVARLVGRDHDGIVVVEFDAFLELGEPALDELGRGLASDILAESKPGHGAT